MYRFAQIGFLNCKATPNYSISFFFFGADQLNNLMMRVFWVFFVQSLKHPTRSQTSLVVVDGLKQEKAD